MSSAYRMLLTSVSRDRSCCHVNKASVTFGSRDNMRDDGGAGSKMHNHALHQKKDEWWQVFLSSTYQLCSHTQKNILRNYHHSCPLSLIQTLNVIIFMFNKQCMYMIITQHWSATAYVNNIRDNIKADNEKIQQLKLAKFLSYVLFYVTILFYSFFFL